jgi:hypothetical protein
LKEAWKIEDVTIRKLTRGAVELEQFCVITRLDRVVGDSFWGENVVEERGVHDQILRNDDIFFKGGHVC